MRLPSLVKACSGTVKTKHKSAFVRSWLDATKSIFHRRSSFFNVIGVFGSAPMIWLPLVQWVAVHKPTLESVGMAPRIPVMVIWNDRPSPTTLFVTEKRYVPRFKLVGVIGISTLNPNADKASAKQNVVIIRTRCIEDAISTSELNGA